jgi:hypothetical protein
MKEKNKWTFSKTSNTKYVLDESIFKLYQLSMFCTAVKTLTNRISSHFAKKSRDQALQERLRKVKQKRLLQEGYSLDEIQGNQRSNLASKLLGFIFAFNPMNKCALKWRRNLSQQKKRSLKKKKKKLQ